MNIIDDINKGIVEIEDYVTALINTLVNPFPEKAKQHIRKVTEAENRPWETSFPDWDSLPGAPHPVARETKIYFIKRSDGTIYAATTNLYRYGETVLDTFIAHTSPYWSIQTSPVVAQHLKYLQRKAKS